MGNIIECANCNNRFNSNNYYSCPKCKTRVESLVSKQSQTVVAENNDNGLILAWERLSPAEKLSIQAQNRTTQAVRSLAITFVAAPIITIALALGMAFAIASNELGLVILTAVIALFLSVYLLVSALTALSRSKIPTYLE